MEITKTKNGALEQYVAGSSAKLVLKMHKPGMKPILVNRLCNKSLQTTFFSSFATKVLI